jgi:hypothetical protein
MATINPSDLNQNVPFVEQSTANIAAGNAIEDAEGKTLEQQRFDLEHTTSVRFKFTAIPTVNRGLGQAQ